MSNGIALDIPLWRRALGFALVLCGFFFYCYNFVVIDYVRPWLIEDYGMSLEQTALLFTVQSLGVLAGTAVTASLVSRYGNKRILVAITCLNGIATMANLYSESFLWWSLLRVLVGVALGGYMTVAVLAILALFPPRVCGRLMALCNAMFAVAVACWGMASSWFGTSAWEDTVRLGGVPALLCGLLMIPLVPAHAHGDSHAATPLGGWSEMFAPRYRAFTLICFTLAGLNFLGYQAFTGFMTLYLTKLDGFPAHGIGTQVTLQGVGALVGGLAWGWVADAIGRRVCLLGFVATAVATALYVTVRADPPLLGVLVFAYGFMVSCTYSWGVYFTELFPAHLRPMGASLFHSGLVVSLLAPSLVALVAEVFDLVTGMLIAPLAFLAAALLWTRLPETLATSPHYRGFNPDDAKGATA